MADQQPALRHPPGLISLIQEAIQKGEGFRLRLFGISMHPFVKAGDVVRVQPVAWEALRPGQVVLFHRNGRLIAHRVLRVAQDPQVVTAKGDTMLRADPPVGRDQLLGEVVSLERSGRVISLRSPGRRLWSALMLRATYPYSFLFYRALLARRAVLRALPAWPAYRRCRRRRGIAVQLRLARASDALSVAGLLADVDVQKSFEQVEVETEHEVTEILSRGGEYLLALVGPTVVGCLAACPEGDAWRVSRLYVHSVHRGMGLAQRLLREFLGPEGREVRSALAVLSPHDRAGLGLLRKMGFVETSGSSDGERALVFRPASTAAASRVRGTWALDEARGAASDDAAAPERVSLWSRRDRDLAGADAA